ncbi:hypothetical protein OKA05_09145 [Luteolibacter arcticus]|uniref:Uncharacterized protein n=1 Tax=Luteolibacter arcticus TaxID=1581411 RepID=A0ABT3GGH6_9BACT|nr:hypothetical protein [Luteolibacter arcticus]MCW1922717.1 hypothetical protein [Luteolibacter arcticus]
MLTREIIAEVERVENELHARIYDTFALRHESAEKWDAWDEATSDWHCRTCPTDILWEDEFLADLRSSQRPAIDDAILYLEADPWYFRSGYLKERLIRGLKSANLTEQDRSRLRIVVWNIATGKNRREFRNYCSLATAVADADFLQRLDQLTPEYDSAARGKFRYLQNYLRRNMNQKIRLP